MTLTFNHLRIFFTKNPNQKGERKGLGGGGEGKMDGQKMDGQMNRPKLICPFNFFEVGDITMHSCTNYVSDNTIH